LYLIMLLAFVCPVALWIYTMVVLRSWALLLFYSSSPLVCYGVIYLALYFRQVWRKNQKYIGEKTPKSTNRTVATVPVKIANLDVLSATTQRQYIAVPANRLPHAKRKIDVIRNISVTISYIIDCVFKMTTPLLVAAYHLARRWSTKWKRYPERGTARLWLVMVY